MNDSQIQEWRADRARQAAQHPADHLVRSRGDHYRRRTNLAYRTFRSIVGRSWPIVPMLFMVAMLVGCVGAADDAPPTTAADGGEIVTADAIAAPDARPADARPVADARPAPDAEVLGDCALTCAGEELSRWSDEYTICRPSYRHCLAAPMCTDACAPGAVLTCSSASNCQCDAVTCVNGTGV